MAAAGAGLALDFQDFLLLPAPCMMLRKSRAVLAFWGWSRLALASFWSHASKCQPQISLLFPELPIGLSRSWGWIGAGGKARDEPCSEAKPRSATVSNDLPYSTDLKDGYKTSSFSVFICYLWEICRMTHPDGPSGPFQLQSSKILL